MRQDAEARFAEEAAADDAQKEDDIFKNLPDDEGKVRKTLIKAIRDGDRNTVVACFARLCPADIADMRKAMLFQDPKVGVSLSWHCKLTSEHARDLQAGLMGIAEASVMVPEGGAASAMSEDDMAWVLQLQGVTT